MSYALQRVGRFYWTIGQDWRKFMNISKKREHWIEMTRDAKDIMRKINRIKKYGGPNNEKDNRRNKEKRNKGNHTSR